MDFILVYGGGVVSGVGARLEEFVRGPVWASDGPGKKYTDIQSLNPIPYITSWSIFVNMTSIPFEKPKN